MIQASYQGRVRKAAFALWKGSSSLRLLKGEGALWSGFCMLRLALRQQKERQLLLEARAVYASLDEEEPQAVLRGLFWDSGTLIGEHRDATDPITIPARFVHIPTSLVYSWLQAFEELSARIATAPVADEYAPICSLRIETD
jgi:hypothetical protein